LLAAAANETGMTGEIRIAGLRFAGH
jgi:hypothetical protein